MTRPAVGTLIPLLRGGGGGVELPEGWNQIVTARALDDISEGDPVTLSYLRPSWGENLGPAPIDLSPLVDIGYVQKGSLSASADFRYFVHVKGFWDSEKSPEVSFYEWSEGVLNKIDFPSWHFLWLKMDKTGRYMIGNYRKDSYRNEYKFIRRDGTSFSVLDPVDTLNYFSGIGKQNVAFSSDSKYLSIGYNRLRVHYDLEDGPHYLLAFVEITPPSRVYSVEWMPDSRVFFVGLRNSPFIKAYLLTDTHQIEEVAVEGLNVSSSVRKLAWSNDSRFLACELVPEGDFDPTLIEIFKHDGNMNFEKVATVDTSDPYFRQVTSILFTPDSNFFIAGKRIYEITPEDDFVLTQQEYIENIPVPNSDFVIHDILVKDDMSLIVYTRPVWPFTSDPPSEAEYPMVFGPAASPENVFKRLVYKDDLRKINSSNQLGVALDTTESGASGRLVVFSKLNEVT